MLALSFGAGAQDAVPAELLSVTLNGVDTGSVVTTLQLPGAGLAISRKDLRAWRIAVPQDSGVLHNGTDYIPLQRIAGLRHTLDAGRQALLLDAPAAAFEGSSIDALAKRTAPVLSPSSTGSFLNYDIFLERSADTGSNAAGLFEWAVFNSAGSGVATAALRTLPGGTRRLVRLDTQWTHDDPAKMQSWRIGDSIGRSGAWGRAVRMGGIQWTSNFAMQPDFVPYALPSVRGEAALPSTLDVYVDNVRRLQMPLQPGPFDISQLPVLTGQGQLQLVVRDVLGRQQTILQPYIASPQLLKPGLTEFSHEAGLLREDYGLASSHYGRWMLASTVRTGVSANFTHEMRVEALAGQQTAGVSGTWLVNPSPFGGSALATASAVLSRSSHGLGQMLQASVEQPIAGASVGARVTLASRDFVQLGQVQGSTPRQTVAANASLPIGDSVLSVSLLQQSSWNGDEQRLFTANYSRRVGNFGQLGVYAVRDLSARGNTSVGLSLTHQLDNRTGLSADLSHQGGRADRQLQLQRQSTDGEGISYRLVAGDSEHSRRLIAGAAWQGPYAGLSAEAAQANGSTSVRFGLRGALALAGGSLFASRSIEDSFAVVDVGGHANVRVYRDNHEVARTNDKGIAFVTRLRAWQPNLIGIEQEDLPMDAKVDELSLRITPGLRTGVTAKFPVHANQAATFAVTDEAGKALPPGTPIHIHPLDTHVLVGLDGRTYIQSFHPSQQLTSERNGRPCTIDLPASIPSGPVPELGALVCRAGALTS